MVQLLGFWCVVLQPVVTLQIDVFDEQRQKSVEVAHDHRVFLLNLTLDLGELLCLRLQVALHDVLTMIDLVDRSRDALGQRQYRVLQQRLVGGCDDDHTGVCGQGVHPRLVRLTNSVLDQIQNRFQHLVQMRVGHHRHVVSARVRTHILRPLLVPVEQVGAEHRQNDIHSGRIFCIARVALRVLIKFGHQIFKRRHQRLQIGHHTLRFQRVLLCSGVNAIFVVLVQMRLQEGDRERAGERSQTISDGGSMKI